MSKNLKRDAQVLSKMIVNVQEMRTAVISFGCKIALTSGPKSLVDNKLAFDLCAFYMAQLGEKVKRRYL